MASPINAGAILWWHVWFADVPSLFLVSHVLLLNVELTGWLFLGLISACICSSLFSPVLTLERENIPAAENVKAQQFLEPPFLSLYMHIMLVCALQEGKQLLILSNPYIEKT